MTSRVLAWGLVGWLVAGAASAGLAQVGGEAGPLVFVNMTEQPARFTLLNYANAAGEMQRYAGWQKGMDVGPGDMLILSKALGHGELEPVRGCVFSVHIPGRGFRVLQSNRERLNLHSYYAVVWNDALREQIFPKDEVENGGAEEGRPEDDLVAKGRWTHDAWEALRQALHESGYGASMSASGGLKEAAQRLRLAAAKIDAVSLAGADEVVEPIASEMSELFVFTALQFDKVTSGGGGFTTALRGIFDFHGVVADAAANGEAIKERGELLNARVRRARRTLADRYRLTFERLYPPIGVAVKLNAREGEHELSVVNGSGEPLEEVTVTWYEPDGEFYRATTGPLEIGGSRTVALDGFRYDLRPEQMVFLKAADWVMRVPASSLIVR